MKKKVKRKVGKKINVKMKKQIKSLKKHKKRNKVLEIKNKNKCIRIPSGIKNFDKLIEGGFEENSTNLLAGGPGSGKTILATQFIMEGLMRGENCLFITFEESKNSFYHNMKRFNWNLEEYEKKESFIFLNYTPGKVKNMLEEGGGTIESVILKKKISRLVIDSMTSFTLLFEDELEKREASLDLFNMIKKWNCTSLVTLEGTPEEEHKIYKALEFESDSIILMKFSRYKITRDRFIEVLKMRGTNHSKGIYKFIISKRGIELSTIPIKNIKGV